MLAATHALVRYGAIGNIAAPGPAVELAVVEETARQALSRWDKRVSHHQVVADLE
jgi:hypothetical protein